MPLWLIASIAPVGWWRKWMRHSKNLLFSRMFFSMFFGRDFGQAPNNDYNIYFSLPPGTAGSLPAGHRAGTRCDDCSSYSGHWCLSTVGRSAGWWSSSPESCVPAPWCLHHSPPECEDNLSISISFEIRFFFGCIAESWHKQRIWNFFEKQFSSGGNLDKKRSLQGVCLPCACYFSN